MSASPLTQGRGLKLYHRHGSLSPNIVAPHTGAWIETFGWWLGGRRGAWSPLTQGRGLKQQSASDHAFRQASPLTQGRGLKRQPLAY